MTVNKTDTRNMWVTLNLCLFVLILAGTYLGVTGQRLINTQTTTANLNNSIVPMVDLFEALLNMETGQRGYLLVEDESFLAPYNEADDLVIINIEKIKKAAETDENVKVILPTVIDLVNKKIAVMEKGIDLQKKGRHVEAVQLIKTGIGKQHMDDFRKIVLPLADEYRKQRLQLSLEANSLIDKIYITAGACAFLLLMIIAISFRSLHSSLSDLSYTNQKVSHIAKHDQLTGLPNRHYCLQWLTQAIDNNQHILYVLFLDLDGFKEVNDTLGHDVGDEVLKQAAIRLKETFRENDFIARLGGDEFVVVLPHAKSQQQVTDLAQRIIQRLEEPLLPNLKQSAISASIGIAKAIPQDNTSADKLLKAADSAMYKAKKAGKHQFAISN